MRITQNSSEQFYVNMSQRYGMSAATTYLVLRCHNQPAWFAKQVMKKQIAELGRGYPGGLECECMPLGG